MVGREKAKQSPASLGWLILGCGRNVCGPSPSPAVDWTCTFIRDLDRVALPGWRMRQRPRVPFPFLGESTASARQKRRRCPLRLWFGRAVTAPRPPHPPSLLLPPPGERGIPCSPRCRSHGGEQGCLVRWEARQVSNRKTMGLRNARGEGRGRKHLRGWCGEELSLIHI